MPPAEGWRGADVANRILETVDELYEVYDALPTRAAPNLRRLIQASRELRHIILDRTRPVMDQLPAQFDLGDLPSDDALDFAIFFKVLAALQRFLVSADMDVLRALCRDANLREEIAMICEAMRAGRRDVAARLRSILHAMGPNHLPSALIHAAETWRGEWYDDADHKPLQISTFLMIRSRDEFEWFCDRLLDVFGSLERLSQRLPPLRRPPDR